MPTCIYCQATTGQRKDGFNEKGIQRYKCTYCNRKYYIGGKPRALPNRIPDVIECPVCGKETTNPKFCSSSCAAKHNNRVYIKRVRKQSNCRSCGKPVEHRRTLCDECNPWIIDWSQRTIGELRRTADYQANARVRNRARTIYRNSDRPKYCERCGYDKYYEVCHIRAISDFPDDAMVTEVNDLSNLLGLCPNCHWEFDHGLLRFENGVFEAIDEKKR